MAFPSTPGGILSLALILLTLSTVMVKMTPLQIWGPIPLRRPCPHRITRWNEGTAPVGPLGLSEPKNLQNAVWLPLRGPF